MTPRRNKFIILKNFRFKIRAAALLLFLCPFNFQKVWGNDLDDAREAAPTQTVSDCSDFLKILRPIVDAKTRLSWRSSILNGDQVVERRKAEKIVAATFHSEPLKQELAEQIKTLGGLQSPKLWDAYFDGYDTTVAFSHGYLQILQLATQYLPDAGNLNDYGTGTGNFAAGLVHFSPERNMRAFDISDAGLKRARAKLAAVSNNSARHVVFSANLVSPGEQDLKTRNADGAIMNNVLYTIPPELRPSVLKRIFDDLRPGSTFVLNDATPRLQSSEADAENFLQQIGGDAAKNGSPMTDYDLAFMAAVNRTVLIGGTGANRFLSRDELRGLAQGAGFVVLDEKSTYYDRTQMFVLRKPD